MDIRPLKQFLSLADSLHFGRASELCHVSPSTLSRAIKQLEQELGVELFIRDNRSVTLTAEGERFQRYARDAVSQWEQLRASLMEQSGVLQGEISLYCSVTASYSFLYDILSRFRRDFPRIEIKLHTGDPEPALSRIQAGTEDLAIAAHPDSLPSGLAFKTIALSPLLFIAPRHTLPGEQPVRELVTAGHWEQVPMIVSEEGLSRKRVNAWFSQRGVKPRIYAQVAGNEAIVSMVSLGFGVGVVPQIVLENSPLANNVETLKVSPALAPYQVGLVAQQKNLRNPLVKALWQQLPDNQR
ncbi:HTH-type transcriptional activator IlvY [Motiliproteus sediminis]|uniref:HTH-type transcriptional activator IlvY n=1 Tax=Motiliproteus sediminis TaxID=1468178 RepID=UPI001AEF3919|nr:HTH-type transcriptional activator IlvY [Motiliproteus sediminis]